MLSFRLPRIYPLTDVRLSGLSHAEQVQLLSLGGATLIQLREKKTAALQLYEQAKAAVAAATKTGAQLIINDRVDIALAAGAHGVHLGQDDMPPEAARRLLGDEAIIGFSTHNVEQARRAWRCRSTTSQSVQSSKPRLNPIPRPRSVSRVCEPFERSLGISARRHWWDFSRKRARVLEAGADSVAVISALFSDPDRITDATRALLQSLPPPRQT